MSETEPSGRSLLAGVARWKVWAGSACFALCFVFPFVVAPIVPFLGFEEELTITLVTMAVVSGELSFLGAGLLLGKAFVIAVKGRMLAFLAPAGPISRRRYHIGVTFLVLSVPPLYVNAMLPYAGFGTEDLIWWSWRLLVLGEVFLVIGGLALGPEFWDRLGSLFRYATYGSPATVEADGGAAGS